MPLKLIIGIVSKGATQELDVKKKFDTQKPFSVLS